MTLEEYIAEEHKRLDEFKVFWLARHEQDPETYPLEMQPGDWDEMLTLEGI